VEPLRGDRRETTSPHVAHTPASGLSADRSPGGHLAPWRSPGCGQDLGNLTDPRWSPVHYRRIPAHY